MLDLIEESWKMEHSGEIIWEDHTLKYLDPFTKSGVFLREIAKRLIEGLEKKFPDLQERVEHIMSNQIFGIGITELTSQISRRSLYCSKDATGEHSIVKSFSDPDGNIWFKPLKHSWVRGKCKYCGASQSQLNRDVKSESHAYAPLHTNNIKKQIVDMFGSDMQFDVIIGNPPYQLKDGGHGKSASPIYHLFVEQAKNLEPRYLCMIIPARWYSGGKGLDSFRKTMLNDENIRAIYDYENFADVFPGVDIAGGVCYFLRVQNSTGICKVVNVKEGINHESHRPLNEFQILIRHGQAIPIIRKILDAENTDTMLNQVISPRKPFGIVGNYKPKKVGVKCHFTQRIGLGYVDQQDMTDNHKILDKWKLLIPRAPIAGQTDFSKPVRFYYDGNTKIAEPGECCSESWLVAYSSDSKEEVLNFKSYLFTKTFRFLLSQAVTSQDISRERFFLVPDLGDYSDEITDELLLKRWNLTEEDWDFIDSRIRSTNE